MRGISWAINVWRLSWLLEEEIVTPSLLRSPLGGPECSNIFTLLVMILFTFNTFIFTLIIGFLSCYYLSCLCHYYNDGRTNYYQSVTLLSLFFL